LRSAPSNFSETPPYLSSGPPFLPPPPPPSVLCFGVSDLALSVAKSVAGSRGCRRRTLDDETFRKTVAATMSGIHWRIFSATENFCCQEKALSESQKKHYYRRGGTRSECISRLISGIENSQCAIRPAYPGTGVNRLRCGRCAYRFRRDAECRFARMSPNERDIARLGVRLFETSYVRAYVLSFSLSLACRLLPAARCSVGVVVGQQAYATRVWGFHRGNTWRGHWVAGITLARWLQLVVAGPRDLRRPSFFLLYVPPRSSSSFLPRGSTTHD
jgi:hypothetical protein